MIHSRSWFPFVLAVACLLPSATAQERTQESGRGRFAATGLEEGSPFPEIDIYDDVGNPYNTRSLKGKYTVVVNGCLT